MSCMRELNEEQTIKRLAYFGLTPETTEWPLSLEWDSEYKQGNISYEEYMDGCAKYGYTPIDRDASAKVTTEPRQSCKF